MKLPDMHSAGASLAATLKRFPASALCAALFTAVAMLDTYFQGYAPLTERVLFLLFSACFGFIALTLLVESRRTSRAVSYGAGVLAGAAITYWAFSGVNTIQLQLMAAASVLLMYVSPYLKLGSNNDQMWTFCYRLSLRIAFTFLAAVVLYLGLVLVVYGVKFLLLGGGSDSGKIYMHMWLAVACLFSPLFAMAGIPSRFDDTEETYPKYMRLLFTYIVLPLWLAYIVILYLYIGKTLFQMALPKGEVAYMVSIFGGITVAIYLKGYPLFRKGEKGIAAFFAANAFNLLVAPLLLLAVSIFTRISDYGVTEERYLLVLIFLWLCSAVVIRRKDDARAPRRILLAALALMVIASFGPWGMSSVSTRSQLARFETLLISNGVLVDGKAVKPQKEIAFSEAGRISDGIDYFVDNDKEEALRPWFVNADEVFACRENCDARYRHDLKRALRIQIGAAFGITYLGKWERTEEAHARKTDIIDYNKGSKRYDVSGYDYYIPFREPDWQYESGLPMELYANRGKPISAMLLCMPQFAICRMDMGAEFTLLTFNIADIIKGHKWQNGSCMEPCEDSLRINAANNVFEAMLVLNLIKGRFLADGTPEISRIGGYILLKRKD